MLVVLFICYFTVDSGDLYSRIINIILIINNMEIVGKRVFNQMFDVL